MIRILPLRSELPWDKMCTIGTSVPDFYKKVGSYYVVYPRTSCVLQPPSNHWCRITFYMYLCGNQAAFYLPQCDLYYSYQHTLHSHHQGNQGTVAKHHYFPLHGNSHHYVNQTIVANWFHGNSHHYGNQIILTKQCHGNSHHYGNQTIAANRCHGKSHHYGNQTIAANRCHGSHITMATKQSLLTGAMETHLHLVR